MKLVLATRNPHKTLEFRELLGSGFEIKDLSSMADIIMPPESGRSFEENATLKVIAASRAIDRLVIADDSGLEVDALGGAPGIYSARYAGQPANDTANIDKLLRELGDAKNRSARFRCVIALSRAGKILGTFEGVVKGTIMDSPRGSGGFGYDPVFQPNGFEATFGEMTAESKNKISHRANAVAALREGLRNLAP